MDENQVTDQQQQNNVEDFQKDLQDAISQAEKNLDGWKRTAADFENYKRRSEIEKKELLEFAKEVTVVKLLPAIDTLEQALRHLPQYPSNQPLPTSPFEKGEESQALQSSPSFSKEGLGEFQKQYQNWQTGINGLVMQLDKVLEELGVKKISALGKKFDPHYHEAVKEVEGDEDSIVVDELQTGFELNGKVIRPSQVVISKKK